MSVAERLRPTTPTRRWAGLGAAALGWFVLYEVNLPLWDWLVYDVVGLAPASRLGSGVRFFFYDSIKIALLLIGIIFLVTVLRSLMSVERTRALLGGKREGVGKVWPNLNVALGKYRFRVYNGSNARFYNLTFTTGKKNQTLPFFQIGSDGGLLNAPVPRNQLLLGPGERADLVVDFAALPVGTTVVLANDAPVPFPGGPRKAKKGGMPLPQIMQFTVTGGVGWQNPLPAALRATPITRYIAAQAVNALAPRQMTLVENLNALGSPLMVLLNNRSFNPNTPPIPQPTDNARVGTNTLEQWDIINTTVDAHPIHLHFTQFQILNRQKFNSAGYFAAAYGPQPLIAGTGTVPPPPVTPFLKGNPVAPAANELGWKDTAVAMPGEVTRILAPFGANIAGVQTAFQNSYVGDYVWHCHILEHEDNDMMQRYVIA